MYFAMTITILCHFNNFSVCNNDNSVNKFLYTIFGKFFEKKNSIKMARTLE